MGWLGDGGGGRRKRNVQLSPGQGARDERGPGSWLQRPLAAGRRSTTMMTDRVGAGWRIHTDVMSKNDETEGCDSSSHSRGDCDGDEMAVPA